MGEERSLGFDLVKIAPLLFCLAIVQVAVMPELTPYAGIPDLVLVLVVALSLWRSVELAAVTGFAGGLLLDAMTFSRLGTLSLLYVLTAVLVAGRAHREPSPGTPGPAPAPRRLVAWTVAGAAAVQVADALLHELLGTRLALGYLVRGQIVPAVIETGLVALLLSPLLKRLFAPPIRRRRDVPRIAAA